MLNLKENKKDYDKNVKRHIIKLPNNQQAVMVLYGL